MRNTVPPPAMGFTGRTGYSKTYDLVDYNVIVRYIDDKLDKGILHHQCSEDCEIFYIEGLPEESRMRRMPCGVPIPTGVLDAFYTYVKFDKVLDK